MKKVLFAVVLLLLSAQFAVAGSYNLVTLENPPFEYTDNGKVTGVCVDVVTEAFKRMGHTVNIEMQPWGRGINLVKTGAKDGIFNALITPERKQFMVFGSTPVVNESATLFVPASSGLTYSGDLNSLKGKTIGVVKGFSYGEKFDGMVKSGALTGIDPSRDLNSNVKKLIGKRFDYYLGDGLVTMFTLNKMGKASAAKRLSPDVASTPTFVGFSKAKGLEALAADFDKTLKGMYDDGSYQKIFDKYTK